VRRLAVLVLTLAALAPGAAAETLYVIDRLVVGIHQDATRDSPVLRLVPTATPLEALEEQGDLVRVRTPDGLEGWVDGDYVSPEMPAQLVVEELEAWKKTREEELKAAWSEVETLRARLEALTAGGEDAAPAGTLQELQRLTEENAELREQLYRVAGVTDPAAVAAPEPAPPPAIPRGLRLEDLPTWAAGTAGALVLVLFFAGVFLGAWLVDVRQRRRHGGFRL
jgi:SH3 domain protein